MTPSPLASTPSRFSSSFISGAISSAASPLQANFNLSCRSPVRPTHDAGGLSSPRRPETATRQTSSPYLEPPRAFPFLGAQPADAKVIYDGLGRDGDYGYDDDDATSASEDESPTDRTWFLPPSPGLPPAGLRREEEGKLGVISAINIIVGKTVGVGAYSVPSAIFDGVGSVGMTLLLWVIGSLISFCGLAVYLVRFSCLLFLAAQGRAQLSWHSPPLHLGMHTQPWICKVDEERHARTQILT